MTPSQSLQRGLEILHRHQDDLEIVKGLECLLIVRADAFFVSLPKDPVTGFLDLSDLNELTALEGWAAEWRACLNCFESRWG